MATIDHLLVGGVQDFKRRHNLAGGERFDLDRAVCQLVRPLGEHLEIVLQRQARRPSRLHLERSRLRACRRSKAERRNGGGQSKNGPSRCHHGILPLGHSRCNPRSANCNTVSVQSEPSVRHDATDIRYAFRIMETSEQTPWRPLLWPFKMIVPIACALLLVAGGVHGTVTDAYLGWLALRRRDLERFGCAGGPI